MEGLAKRGMASGAELEQGQGGLQRCAGPGRRGPAAVPAQAAALERRQTNLSQTTLVSPIDGTVIELSREVGERVRGSDFSEDVVMTMAALAAMEVKIEVGEHEVVHLKHGPEGGGHGGRARGSDLRGHRWWRSRRRR